MSVALFFAAVLAAGFPSPGEHILPARRHGHLLILSQVYLNGHGPFRMMVDTGAAASAIRPGVAVRLGLTPRYRVELVTGAGSSLVPASTVSVRVGAAIDPEVEVLHSPIAVPGVDGVLGQSWLARHSYLLDYENGQVVLDGPPPTRGLRLPLVDSDDRPSIQARVDGKRENLVLDSGASALTLFRSSPRSGPRAVLATHSGTADATLGTSIVALGSTWRRAFQSATLAGRDGSGLLPAEAFRAVYVSRGRKLVVLAPWR